MNKKSVIILAGGSGKRMKSKLPKQFLLLNNKPIIFYSIEQFFNYDNNIQIILVLPKTQIEPWQQLTKKYNFKIPVEIAIGGKERFQSAQNGFKKVKHEKIAIHDAVRPLISQKLITEGFNALDKHHVAIPVIKPKNSYRILTQNNNSQSLDRNKLRIVQTPQFFVFQALKDALSLPYSKKFTDEATAAQQAGYTVMLFNGDEKNIKITTPPDLAIAHTLLNL